MKRQHLIEILGDWSAVSDARHFRDYLSAVLCWSCGPNSEELKKAREALYLISYWINADDGSYCPIDTVDIERTVCTLINVLIYYNGFEVVIKSRFNYDELGKLVLVGGLGAKTFSKVIQLLDILCLEYVARKECPQCGKRIGESDIVCGYCGKRLSHYSVKSQYPK